MHLQFNKSFCGTRFTRAERELSAARPFGYGPRKFYESSQLVLGAVDAKPSDKDKQEKPPEPVEVKQEDAEKDKKLKTIYIAVTSDRGQ